MAVEDHKEYLSFYFVHGNNGGKISKQLYLQTWRNFDYPSLMRLGLNSTKLNDNYQGIELENKNTAYHDVYSLRIEGHKYDPQC